MAACIVRNITKKKPARDHTIKFIEWRRSAGRVGGPDRIFVFRGGLWLLGSSDIRVCVFRTRRDAARRTDSPGLYSLDGGGFRNGTGPAECCLRSRGPLSLMRVTFADGNRRIHQTELLLLFSNGGRRGRRIRRDPSMRNFTRVS